MTVLEYFNELSAITDTREEVKGMAWIFRAVFGKEVYEWEKTEISSEDAKKLAGEVMRLKNGEPVAYILGTTDFFWCELSVDSNVLIPRPETEDLCDIIVKENELDDARVLDLCTGSGCIAIALKKTKPAWSLDATDVSSEAIALAQNNASKNNVEINAFVSDMWENLDGTYDIIVSNPPYIDDEGMATLPKSVTDFEPHLALYGGADGLNFYRDIAKNAHKFLNSGGYLYLEIGVKQDEEIVKMLEKNFTDITLRKDLFGFDRYILARRK